MRLALTIALFFAVSAAQAQEQCTKITVDSVRLACYDALFRGAEDQLVTTSEEKPIPSRGLISVWNVRTEKSRMTDQTDVYLSVESDEPVYCSWGVSPVRLLLRCKENRTNVLLITSCHVTSGHGGYGRVTYRVDDRKSMTRNFEESTDNRSLGLWSFGRARPFIGDLMDGKELLIRFTPFGESPKETTFSIHGLEDAIEPLRGACGW